MIIDAVFISHLMNGVLMVALPLVLGWYLTSRFKTGWRLWWIGAATFVLSQALHIPFNQVLTILFQRGVLPAPPESWQIPFNAVILGLSAGIFEECARYLTYRWWAKDARDWSKGLVLGAGHGGVEAILLGVLVLVNFAGMVAVRGMDINTLVAPEQMLQAQQQVQAYWGSAWYANLLGALERLFTLPFHLAASLMVMQVFVRKQSRWLWFAIFWHAALNAAALIVLRLSGPYIAELVIGLFAVVNLLLIFVLRGDSPQSVDAGGEPPTQGAPLEVKDAGALAAELPEEPALDEEKLDESRFT